MSPKIRKPPKGAIILIVVVIALCVGGFFLWRNFRATPIGNISADPQAYDGKTVTVAGTVQESGSLLGFGAFQIKDDTGSIWAHKQGAVPNKGEKIRIKGRVDTVFQLGDMSVVAIEVLE